MTKVLKLALTKVDVKRRQEAREVLEAALADKMVETAFVVTIRADNTWNWEMAGNNGLQEILGYLEVAKHEMVAKYVRDQT